MEPSIVLHGKKVLVFIVAYNAEKTLGKVLMRIPPALRDPNVAVLVIDDSSKDQTFRVGLPYEKAFDGMKITILRTPENQGYGGNQKLGYEYAIKEGFDIVALVHGDGQYAPEKLPMLLEPLLTEKADAVFGSRMIDKASALKGGMPLYKWVGNQVLTRFQNWFLGTHLSEFHTGYRLYSTSALRQIPFQRNSNDFHFDTDIIIQLVMKKLVIKELPIPTFYGDEVCHVNGMKYAWNIFQTMVRNRFHTMNLLYDRKFDIAGVERPYNLKVGYTSSHTVAIQALLPEAKVLVIGFGNGDVTDQLVKQVAALPDRKGMVHQLNLDLELLPKNLSGYDQILILDVIEHLKDPEVFMEKLRDAMGCSRTEIIVTTPNVGFFVVRIMLLLGWFNYGRKGILDRTHSRLFTVASIRELFQQTGYKVSQIVGIPAPYPEAIGTNFFSRVLLNINSLFIWLSIGLFSYQICLKAKAMPTVEHLLEETVDTSTALKNTMPTLSVK